MTANLAHPTSTGAYGPYPSIQVGHKFLVLYFTSIVFHHSRTTLELKGVKKDVELGVAQGNHQITGA